MQSGTTKRLDVQGLRAVAVLAVVIFHAGLPLRGGFAGVDVFFVISGYIITLVLSRELDTTGTVKLGAFYVRRFKRLTPALAAMVTAIVVASFVIQTPFGDQQSTARLGTGAMLLIANYRASQIGGGYFGVVAETNPLLHTWSLSVEEQFYLVFPALLLFPVVLRAARRDRRRLQIVIVALIAAASLAVVFATSTGQHQLGMRAFVTGFYSPFTRAFEFAAGALLALAGPRAVRAATATGFGVAGALGVVAAFVIIPGSANFPNLWTVLVVVSTLLLIAAGSAPANVTSRTLAAPVLVLIGDLSYSIYLWHWPLIVFARRLFPEVVLAAPIAAVISLVAGAASYRWVEQPLRRRPIATRGRLLATILATSGVCYAVSSALLAGSSMGWGNASIEQVQQARRDQHSGYDCMANITTGGRKRVDLEKCTWNADAIGEPIYLFGDSNAAQYSEGLLAYAESADRPLIIDTTAGCPFVDVYVGRVEDEIDRNARVCRSEYVRRSERLQSAAPGTVLIAESSRYVLDQQRPIGPTPDALTANVAQRSEIFAAGLAQTTRALMASGHSVVLVEPLVWLPGGGPPISADQCVNVGLLAGRCPHPAKLSEFGTDYTLMSELVSRVAADTGAAFLPVVAQACPDGNCLAWQSDYPVYMNMDHFSANFSAALAPFFERSLPR